MVALTLIFAVWMLGASALSRSGLAWSLLLCAGMALGFTVSSVGLHGFLFVVDLAFLMTMIAMRQAINQWWQDGVIFLQIVISVIYLVFTVYAGRAEWLVGASIDVANVLFLAQVALTGFGGLRNSIRNVSYIRRKRLPLLPTAWRMT